MGSPEIGVIGAIFVLIGIVAVVVSGLIMLWSTLYLLFGDAGFAWFVWGMICVIMGVLLVVVAAVR